MMEPSDTSNQPLILVSAANRFLSDGKPQKVEVELSPDLLKRLRDLGQEHGLAEGDAIRMAVAAGVAFLSAERAVRTASGIGERSAEEVEKLLARHIELEANYAVMKNRLWLAMQDNQAMSLRDGALTATIEGLRNVVERLKAELAEAQKLGATTPAHSHQETRPVASLANAPRRRNLARRLWAAIRRVP